ncbi:MAG TPA: hypothetical protein VEH06_01180 [Candidatus Bathyarchaeia archaeon]|nr:hypothetical protein [Candidatus Bathyarchaeia archaeon]
MKRIIDIDKLQEAWRQTSNEEDGIYTGPSTDGLMQRNSGEELMVHLIKEGHSFLGTFNIVLHSGQPKQ